MTFSTPSGSSTTEAPAGMLTLYEEDLVPPKMVRAIIIKAMTTTRPDSWAWMMDFHHGRGARGTCVDGGSFKSGGGGVGVAALEGVSVKLSNRRSRRWGPGDLGSPEAADGAEGAWGGRWAGASGPG